MNRFEKFLDESGISQGHLHNPAERAQYFLWYHSEATEDKDADLGLIAKYFEEAALPAPDLYEICDEYFQQKGKAGVKLTSVPGRFRVLNSEWFEGQFKSTVFGDKSLKPLYFRIGPDGEHQRIGSIWDKIKYWPQHHWFATWLALSFSLAGLFLGVLSVVRPA